MAAPIVYATLLVTTLPGKMVEAPVVSAVVSTSAPHAASEVPAVVAAPIVSVSLVIASS